MANTNGLTLAEVNEVDVEVQKRMSGSAHACNCGDGARGHSPDCAHVLGSDQEYDYLFELILDERADAAEQVEQQRCDAAAEAGPDSYFVSGPTTMAELRDAEQSGEWRDELN